MLSVALDACFHLKWWTVSSKEKDPTLGSRWGYFIEDMGYRELLRSYGDQSEVRALWFSLCPHLLPDQCLIQLSSCTGLSAIDYANLKYHKGYVATGVGAIVCS